MWLYTAVLDQSYEAEPAASSVFEASVVVEDDRLVINAYLAASELATFSWLLHLQHLHCLLKEVVVVEEEDDAADLDQLVAGRSIKQYDNVYQTFSIFPFKLKLRFCCFLI